MLNVPLLCKQYSKLESKASDYEMQKSRIQDKLNDLEARSMRDNLLFMGIEESQDENCTEKIKLFCENELRLSPESVSNMIIDRAHRIGKFRAGSRRPIVAKFNRYSERETVRTKANEMREPLRAKNFTVKPQMPTEVLEKRKPLYSVFEAEQAKGNRCKFVLDKLYVNGRLYIPPGPSDSSNLPR